MSDKLGLELPEELVQRRIEGYWLHSDRGRIYLEDHSSDHPERSLATRRVLLDRFLTTRVLDAGVEVYGNRVTDVEFTGDEVSVYTEGGSFTGDILVGAFGLDRQMSDVLSRRTGYRSPDFLETVITKIHPGQQYVDSFGNDIHAFLPADPQIEFAALTPKGNHVTALVAGRRVTGATLRAFPDSPRCREVMSFPMGIDDIYKGSFPISPARDFYGERYITIGDSAGLVRPFKGKGINMALLSGWYAARNILQRGVTEAALSQVKKDFSEQIGDLWYGRAARWMAGLLSRYGLLEPVLRAARHNDQLRQALYDSVSARDTYRNILNRSMSPGVLLAISGESLRWLVNRRKEARPAETAKH
jgi:flavin-dependent dehydrogenase